MQDLVFFTRYGYAGASTRYRVFHYKQYLEKAGFTVTILPFFTDAYLQKLYSKQPISKAYVLSRYVKRVRDVLTVKRDHCVYIEYELLPYFPAWFEWLLRRKGVKYVVDYDDAIFHRYDQHSNTFIRALLPGKIAAVIRNAGQVIVGSSYLYNYAIRYNKKVSLIPTSIVFESYDHQRLLKENKPFTIGWIGLASNSINVIDIAPALQKFARGKKVRLLLIGFDEGKRDQLGDIPVEIRKWSEETEVANIMEFDVGIMPLLDTPFNRGKCGFKLVQYMACGKPTIATPLPANVDMNIYGENLLATSIDEWANAFNTIYSKQDFYAQEVGSNNKKIVRQHYSIEANHPFFTNLFKTPDAACVALPEA